MANSIIYFWSSFGILLQPGNSGRCEDFHAEASGTISKFGSAAMRFHKAMSTFLWNRILGTAPR
jgi:hypothetical protein